MPKFPASNRSFHRAMKRTQNPYSAEKKTLYFLKKDKKGLKSLGRKIEDATSEKKYLQIYNQTLAGDALPAVNGYVKSLSDTPIGDTETSRDGSQLEIRSLEMKIIIELGTQAVGTNPGFERYRIIIFQWFENDAHRVPVMGDILEQTVAAPNASYNVLCSYNHDNRYLYNILYDSGLKRLTFPGTLQYAGGGITQTDWCHHTFNFFLKKFRRRKIQYNSGNNTGTNKIYMLAYSDVIAASNPPIIFFQSKLNFNDA